MLRGQIQNNILTELNWACLIVIFIPPFWLQCSASDSYKEWHEYLHPNTHQQMKVISQSMRVVSSKNYIGPDVGMIVMTSDLNCLIIDCTKQTVVWLGSWYNQKMSCSYLWLEVMHSYLVPTIKQSWEFLNETTPSLGLSQRWVGLKCIWLNLLLPELQLESIVV